MKSFLAVQSGNLILFLDDYGINFILQVNFRRSRRVKIDAVLGDSRFPTSVVCDQFCEISVKV